MRFIALIFLVWVTSANASITEGARGVLFGQDHAFAITAKAGWVLDNESGVNQGVYMIFYPKGGTWENSPVIIYGESVSTKVAANPKQQVEQNVKYFKDTGNPNYSSQIQPDLILPNGRKVAFYYFSGDQWGNYEAAAYFQEVDSINFLVFNSRTKANFDKYIGDFRQMVSTYQNLYTPPKSLSGNSFQRLKRESDKMLSKRGGKDYESKAIQAVGQNVANVMQDCAAYIQDKELPAFNYFVRIGKNGNVTDSYVFPTNALSVCFKAMMSSTIYPPHKFGSFVLNIDMKIKP